MQLSTKQGKRRQIRSRKRPHLGILTLDDLDIRLWKHNQLITKLRDRYKADKELNKSSSEN